MTDTRKTSALDADEREALLAIGWRESAGSSACPDSSLLIAVEEGVLDDGLAARVRGHVAGCATCQQLTRDLAAVLAEEPDAAVGAGIRARVAAGAPGQKSHPYIWWGAGLAAAAAIAWFIVMPRSAQAPPPDSQVARATPSPIPSVFVVGRPAIPPGDVDLTVRGEASKQTSLEDQIAFALDTADKGDVTEAGSMLARIARNHPSSRIAFLALGAIQLRVDQNTEALATLERARTLKGDAATADEAGWFLAIARMRAGDRTGARELLDAICKNAGPRSPSACAGITEIDRAK